ncbi:MAG TPA: succinate dehydrogenase, cytochrome b556 subunit [Terriglobia bacterium]|nr:succinate dehydrogenase, cytochrome b556 subunit [Terriglobia bacterium]
MSVKPQQYFTYRGKGGQWSWILHRLTGLGVFTFLLVHIIDTALIGWGPDAYNSMMAVYRVPFFRVGEVLLAGAVLYHALNGVRICIIDFWPGATAVHRKLVLAVVVLFAVIYIPSAVYMLRWLVQ